MAGGSKLPSPFPPPTWAGVVRNGHPATRQGSDPSSVQQGPSHATILQQMFQSCVARGIARLELKTECGAVEIRLVCQTSTAASASRKQGRLRPANQRRRQKREEWLLRKKSTQTLASTTAGAEAAMAATAATAVDQRSPAVKEPAAVSDQPAASTAATELPRAPPIPAPPTTAPPTTAPPIAAPPTPAPPTSAPPTPASSSLDQPTPAPAPPTPGQPTQLQLSLLQVVLLQLQLRLLRVPLLQLRQLQLCLLQLRLLPHLLINHLVMSSVSNARCGIITDVTPGVTSAMLNTRNVFCF
jgi:hypothetical protein